MKKFILLLVGIATFHVSEKNEWEFSGPMDLIGSFTSPNHFLQRRDNHGSKIRWRHQEYRARSWRFC